MKIKHDVNDADLQVILKMVIVFSKAVDGIAKSLADIAKAVKDKQLILK